MKAASVKGFTFGVAGAGSVGCAEIECLTTGGADHFIVVDRDIVDEGNLSRCPLYTREEVDLPKAAAAERALRRQGFRGEFRPVVRHLDGANVERLFKGAAVVLDGTDNLPARFVLNQFAVKEGVPFIYAGAVQTRALVFPVLPGGPCLECLLPAEPARGRLETCEVEGLSPAASSFAGRTAAGLALSLGGGQTVEPQLHRFDHAADPPASTIRVTRRRGCPVCAGEYNRLGRADRLPVRQCGREEYQLFDQPPDLGALEGRLSGFRVKRFPGGLVARRGKTRIAAFGSGRYLVMEPGITPDRARALLDSLLG